MFEDTPLQHVPTIIVRTNDGTVFTCTALLLKDVHPSQFRWRLTDSAGRSVMGPAYLPHESPWLVERRIGAWWEVCKALEKAATRRLDPTPAA